jgi:neutral ceramidase
VDQDVPVLSVRRPDGSLLAVLFGYSCHATVLNQYEINGDWPGFAQAALEKEHPGAMAVFVNGCGADQNPLPRRKVELVRKYGEIIAEAVNQLLAGKMKAVPGHLRAVYDTVDVPFQKAPTRAEFEQRLSAKNASVRNHAQLMLEILDRNGKLPDRYPYPVQIWRFGDSLTFISLAGEVVVDYSLRFKREYGWDNTWVSGYNNDVFAYIPSLRVLREGGYEGGGAMIGYGQPAPFGEAVEEVIAGKVAELARRAGATK